jgi:biotin transport system substrate-specific component
MRGAVTSAAAGLRGAAASLGTRFRHALDLRPLTVTDLARIPVFAALTAVLAQASVHLFGNAVPITGQTLGVMLAGLILGPIRGGLAIAVYVVLGAAGLPIFANATGGAGIISGPTGGFILAFPIAAFVIGLLTARVRQLTPAIAFTACVVGGIAVVYLIGVPWLAWKLGLTAEEAVVTGAIAFVPGDLIKAALATYVAVGVYRAYPALGGVRARTS